MEDVIRFVLGNFTLTFLVLVMPVGCDARG